MLSIAQLATPQLVKLNSAKASAAIIISVQGGAVTP